MAKTEIFANLPAIKGLETKCRGELQQFLGRNGLSGSRDWIMDVPEAGHLVWKTRTEQLGRWIKIWSVKDSLSDIIVSTADEESYFAFESATCEFRLTKTEKFPQATGRAFSDSDINALVKAKKSALIYVWSPDQIYSQKFWRRFKDVAAKRNMVFIPVQKKPFNPPTRRETYAELPKDFFTLNHSNELLMMGATVHTPSAVIVKGGKLSSPIIGVLGPDLLEKTLNQRLSRL